MKITELVPVPLAGYCDPLTGECVTVGTETETALETADETETAAPAKGEPSTLECQTSSSPTIA